MRGLEVGKIRSSEKKIEDFLASDIWKDMKDEVTVWRETLRDKLETDYTKEDAGRSEACGYFLRLPEVILEDLKSLRKENEDE